MFSHVLLHVPHASVHIPQEWRKDFLLADLQRELYLMTDHLCHRLFACGEEMILPPISRLVCDMERFRQDEREPMAQKGMGAVYTNCADGSPLRYVTAARREAILQAYYDPHHARLQQAVKERLDAYGKCLLIDGHSFHPEPLPYEEEQGPRPDFCIGSDPVHTPPVLVREIKAFLEERGSTVFVNRPFAGSMVPNAYYQKDRRVQSVMIEVNRGLYLGEGSDFPRVHRLLCQLIAQIKKAAY